MKIDQSTLLFFDASCLIAAAGSPSGGSGFLLLLCARRQLQGAVSHVVLLEAERNIRDKLRPQASDMFKRWLLGTSLVVAPIPSALQTKSIIRHVTAKDQHVVAATLAILAPFLLTLDKELARQVNQITLPIQAFSPGGFIKTILPQHRDFPSLR